MYVERMTVFVRDRILKPHRPAIEALAAEIEAKRDLSGVEIRELLDHRRIQLGR